MLTAAQYREHAELARERGAYHERELATARSDFWRDYHTRELRLARIQADHNEAMAKHYEMEEADVH